MFKMVRVVVVIAVVTAMGCVAGQAQAPKADGFDENRAHYEATLEYLTLADIYMRRLKLTEFESNSRDVIGYAVKELRSDGIKADPPPLPLDPERGNYNFRIEESLAWAALELADAKDLPRHAGMRAKLIADVNRAQVFWSSAHPTRLAG
jgi:hypothetical protein